MSTPIEILDEGFVDVSVRDPKGDVVAVNIDCLEIVERIIALPKGEGFTSGLVDLFRDRGLGSLSFAAADRLAIALMERVDSIKKNTSTPPV